MRKNVSSGIMLLLLVLLVLPAAPASASRSIDTSLEELDSGDCTAWDLLAGKDIDVGSVIVTEGMTDGGMPTITVEFQLVDCWELVETHVSVVSDPTLFPQTTKQGNPKVGHFDKESDHIYEYEIADITMAIGRPIYIAAHAEVKNSCESDPKTGRTWSESAWAGGSECNPENEAIRFNNKNWATYFAYEGGNGAASISDNVMLLTDEIWQLLSDVSSDGMIFTFTGCSDELDMLIPGDIIVSSTTDATPDGLLRRITGIVSDECVTVVETEQSTLEDVIEEGSFGGSWSLLPDGSFVPNLLTENHQDVSQDILPLARVNEGAIDNPKDGVAAGDLPERTALASTQEFVAMSQACEGLEIYIDDVVVYDDDGNLLTENDQVRGSGSICLQLNFGWDWQRRWGSPADIYFAANMREAVDFNLSWEVSREIPLYKKEFWRYYCTPIVTMVGLLPVVFTPVITAEVGADGEVSAGITVGITQTTSTTLGVTREDGNWGPISDFSSSFGWEPPSPTGGGKIKGYVGPRFNLLLYGIVGPYVSLDGYLELDVDLIPEFWWGLYGGSEAGVGCKVDVLGRNLADYSYPGVIGWRILLAQSESPGGEIIGNVVDAVTSSPLEGVQCSVYEWVPWGDLVTTGFTDSNGAYSLHVPAGDGYVVEFREEGYQTEIYYDITVASSACTYLQAVLQIDEAHSGQGNASGTIVNALSGNGVGGVTVSLRDGINQTSGPIVVQTSTASSGLYSFEDLEAGNYTAEISKSGFITSHFTVTCLGGITKTGQDATISPEISAGETRIVLTWGANPSDLDSHFTGPLPSGGRFHMYYPYAEANSGSQWPGIVQLDLDDVTSYGPETTTLLSQTDGVYRFSVHDYTNRGSSSSTALSSSGAQVEVYRGNSLLSVFPVPINQGGTLWTVFEMEDNTITPINTLSYHSAPSTIP